MKITIISVGRIKEQYLEDAIREYSKRLSKYCSLDFVEVQDEKAPENMSEKEIESLKEKEGMKIIKNIKDRQYVIVLEIKGKQTTSEEVAYFLNNLSVQGKSEIVFIIGGSLGLAKEVLARADYKLSFSKLTFPHQLMKVILLEQIYRSFKIIKGEPYHK
ncbi:MAG: 23S rRNA (pseudouridine(1915)-N(3))-methyltransferase RlmH [Clostridiales bacterium GWE2_32_10]|nr:MAG: 23S rRNA (pseudouridine(1915)-N(3))-methyltransferase RlmH [Clostridiales bacterium GWE2_32_10]HBY20394.1 23S rRNA (pseudouridine(1915)-N(3))-methyltransferase RlmH [Clostridiales bacterium]